MAHHDLVVLARRPHTIRHFPGIATILGGLQTLLPYDRRPPRPLAVGGHYGVTRSLVAGLRALGADFAYEPDLRRTTARAAIVLAGIEGLRTAIAWKRDGGCRMLLAGPNLVDNPNDHDGVLLDPAVDRIIVASDKVRDQYAGAAPSSIGRVRAWPAGVDTDYWCPSGRGERRSVLVYNKWMDDLAMLVEARLRDRGIATAMISYSGKRRTKYSLAHFRALLDRSAACVFLSEAETQGLAAIEAWSMDVPTLAFDRHGRPAAPPLPYLTLATGAHWRDPEELMARLSAPHGLGASPRAWVLANMTDRLSAARLLAITREGDATT